MWYNKHVMNKHQVISGFEGCGKSTTILNETLSSLSKNEYAFYSAQNYKALLEKQNYLIKTYGGDINTYPICSHKLSNNNNKYVWNIENPELIPDEAKIV